MDMLHSTISSIITEFGILPNKHAWLFTRISKEKTCRGKKEHHNKFQEIFEQCYANHDLTSSSDEMEKETSRKIISTPFLGAVKSTFPSLGLMLKLVGRSFRITVCPSSCLYIVHTTNVHETKKFASDGF